MKTVNLAIIPARGGSKGIYRKNIVKLNDLPLIVYSIRAALESKNTLRVIVSTEDSEISDIAKSYGAEVLTRPLNLAQDDSSSSDVIIHCLDTLELRENYKPDIVILLQPTSPLRTSVHIDAVFELFNQNVCDAVISVSEPIHHPLKSFKLNEDGYLTGMFKNEFCFLPRQKLPKVLVPNGAIYLIKTAIFKVSRSLIPPKTVPYIMSKINSVDIDDMDDLNYGAFLMSISKSNEKNQNNTTS